MRNPDAPRIHGRDARAPWPSDGSVDPGGADPHHLNVDSTENVGTDQGVRSYGATVGHVLTATASGNTAWQAVPSAGGIYTDFSPTLTATTTDPTLAAGSAIVARYSRIGNLVHYYGEATLSGGLDPGSGRWRLSTPAHHPNSVDTGGWTSRPNGGAGVAYLFGQNSSGGFVVEFEVVGDGTTPLVFLTTDTYPFGNPVYLSDTAGITFADPDFADILIWSVVYETDPA